MWSQSIEVLNPYEALMEGNKRTAEDIRRQIPATPSVKPTEERLTIVKEMQSLITEWLDYVEDPGNECAYTDSILELIQKKAKEL